MADHRPSNSGSYGQRVGSSVDVTRFRKILSQRSLTRDFQGWQADGTKEL